MLPDGGGFIGDGGGFIGDGGVCGRAGVWGVEGGGLGGLWGGGCARVVRGECAGARGQGWQQLIPCPGSIPADARASIDHALRDLE